MPPASRFSSSMSRWRTSAVELMMPVGGERHGFLRPAAALWLVVAVELPDLGEDPAAGGAGEVEAPLLQGGVHPEGADLRVLRELPDLLDGREGHLSHAGGPSVRPVRKPGRSFLHEAL